MIRRRLLRAGITASLAASLAAGVTGCGGWHLRGTNRDSRTFQYTWVDAGQAPRLNYALSVELYRSGFTRVGTREAAEAIIEIGRETFRRRVVSVDPETGKVREVELQLTADVGAVRADGTTLMETEPMVWAQDFVFDETSLLGNTEQERLIELELAEVAARTIVYLVDASDQ